MGPKIPDLFIIHFILKKQTPTWLLEILSTSYSKPHATASHSSTTTCRHLPQNQAMERPRLTHPCTFSTLSSPRRKLVWSSSQVGEAGPALQGGQSPPLINHASLRTSPCSFLPLFHLLTLNVTPHRTSMTTWAHQMPDHGPACSIVHPFLCSWAYFLRRFHVKPNGGYYLCEMLKVFGSALC